MTSNIRVAFIRVMTAVELKWKLLHLRNVYICKLLVVATTVGSLVDLLHSSDSIDECNYVRIRLHEVRYIRD